MLITKETIIWRNCLFQIFFIFFPFIRIHLFNLQILIILIVIFVELSVQAVVGQLQFVFAKVKQFFGILNFERKQDGLRPLPKHAKTINYLIV